MNPVATIIGSNKATADGICELLSAKWIDDHAHDSHLVAPAPTASSASTERTAATAWRPMSASRASPFFDPNFGEFWFEDKTKFPKWFTDVFFPRSTYSSSLNKSYRLYDYALAARSVGVKRAM